MTSKKKQPETTIKLKARTARKLHAIRDRTKARSLDATLNNMLDELEALRK